MAPGMSELDKLIAQVYAPRILVEVQHNTVSNLITNTEYSAQLRAYGDNILIPFSTPMKSRLSAIGAKHVYDNYTFNNIKLKIDHVRTWGFTTHKADNVQSYYKDYAGYVREACSQGFQEDIDLEVFSEMALAAYVKGNAWNNRWNLGSIGTPVAVNPDNALRILNNIETAARETLWTDKSEMFAVCPWWFINNVAQSDLKNISIVGGTESPVKKGIYTLYKARTSNITLIASTLLPYLNPATSLSQILFGTKRAMSQVVQISGMGVIRGDKDMPTTDFHWGEFVYGRGVIHNKELGQAVIIPASGAFGV